MKSARTLAITLTASATLLTPAVAQAHPGIDTFRPEPTELESIPGCQNVKAPNIAADAAQIAQPPSGHWDYSVSQNYNPCRDLSYVTLTEDIRDGDGVDQLLLYHRGEFIGTGTIHQLPYQQVIDATDDSVTVSYGTEQSVTYRWVGDHVEMEGVLPPQ